MFENLLVNMKKAGFNTIYCVHRDWRVDLCRKHGIKMMVDVLAWKEGVETDIRRNEQQRARVKQICEKSRGDDAIWGYNIWNETLSYFGHPDGKSIDDYIWMLKRWDPTHPVWMGTYRVSYANGPKSKPGVHAYYDYAWQRGFVWHFADLKWYSNYVPGQKGVIGQWEMGSDYHRNSYKLNTSIPFGMKVVIWFIGGPFDAKGDIDPKHRFYHLVKIGQEMSPLYKELGKFGMPEAVYSTTTTKSETNQPKTPGLPWNLRGFPEKYWLRIVEGEVLCGFFRYANGDDAIYVANHNAFADQQVHVALQGDGVKKSTLEIFDRAAGQWKKLDKGTFSLRAAGGELLRVEGRTR